MFCTTMGFLVLFAWGVSCEKCSASFTGIRLLLLGVHLKRAHFFAADTRNGWCLLEEEKQFWAGFSFDLKLIGNLCLPLSCCFWFFSTPPFLFAQAVLSAPFFFVQLIQSFTYFFSQMQDKKQFPFKNPISKHIPTFLQLFYQSKLLCSRTKAGVLPDSSLFPFKATGYICTRWPFPGWHQDGNDLCH